MKLDEQEILAIRIVFHDNTVVSQNILELLDSATVIEREKTGVGFYSTIRLSKPLVDIPNIRIREFNFEHPEFLNGGSYMCWFVDSSTIEIEAVTLGEEDWPTAHLDIELFKELN